MVASHINEQEEPTVLVESVDGTTTITLNRPSRLNALNDDLVVALGEALRNVDPASRVVVIRGAGTSFSSGHDLKEPRSTLVPAAVAVRNAAENIQEVTREIRRCPVPVVSIVRGYAIGAGAEISLSCDFVVAARTAMFRFPEASLGLVVTNGFTALLPRVVGAVRAKQILILGQPFSGEDAFGWGLASEVADESELEVTAQALIATLIDRPTLGVKYAKQLIDTGLHHDIELTLAREVAASVVAELSDDAQMAISSFSERDR